MTALAPETSQVLAADVRLDATIALPELVLSEAALAASVLLRLSTQPFGSTAWLDYHARFRTRYGPGALIPVRELVADSGLGYPSGYLGAPRTRPTWRELTERDAAILALMQRAILDGAQEIELTDADVEVLTIGEHADIVAPQRIELGVALHAASTDAIDRGVFELRVVAAPRVPTSMAGRFAHLLDHQERALLAATFETGAQATEAGEPVAVQLSFPPRRPHDDHVVRVPRLLPDVVSLAEHPDADNIDIEDLAVTADGDQMYLVQLSTGRRVIPRIPHALELGSHTPPLARFIAEVADARTATFGPFNPGAARTLPYIPRIRYRRTVLAAARWTLNSADLPSPSHQPLEESLASWRRQWRVPARVILELQDDSPQSAQDWIGRPAELLIPMTAIDPPARPLPRTAPPGSVMRAGNSLVVHAHLVGNPARFDAILTRHLPAFARTLADAVELWWMRRHRDMIHPHADQHLALLFRLNSPDQYGPVAARIAAFAAELEARGLPAQLTLAPYPLHSARYGKGPAMAAAERVFATDTTCAITQLATADASDIPAQALAAASMTHLAAAFAPHPKAGYRALAQRLPRDSEPVDRAVRDHTFRLADPADSYRAVRALPGGDRLAAAWQTRGEALAGYYQALTEQRDPTQVLRTLLHEHHRRAIGVDPAFERKTGHLARAAAMRRLALADAL